MKRRWEVVCIDRDGNEIGEPERFWFRRSAVKTAEWHDRTAWGTHTFLTPVTEQHGPLFTVQIRQRS